jgi:hypothetical protein
VSFTGHDLTSINTINAQTLNVAGTTDTDKLWSNIQYCGYLKDRNGYLNGDTWVNGRNVFYFGEYFCTNYRNWDWNGNNLVNCNWIGSYETSEIDSYLEPISMIDDIEIITSDNKLKLSKKTENILDGEINNTFEFEQLIYSLVKEVKDLKKEIEVLKGGIN